MKNFKLKKMPLRLVFCLFAGLVVSLVIFSFIQQFFLTDSKEMMGFLKHNFLHLMILGSIMFLVLWILFQIMILSPIYKIYQRLNELTYKKSEGSYCIEGEDLRTVLESINRLINIHEKTMECSSMQETHKIIDI